MHTVICPQCGREVQAYGAAKSPQPKAHACGEEPTPTLEQAVARLVRALGPQARSDELMRRAVEEGVEAGWRQAHKYGTTPAGSQIQDEIECAVIAALQEVFEW